MTKSVTPVGSGSGGSGGNKTDRMTDDLTGLRHSIVTPIADARAAADAIEALAALTIRPEAEVLAETWAAATAAFDALLFEFQHEPGRCGYEATGALKMRERLRKRMAADISAALDRIKAEAHDAGMREAALIAKGRAGSPDYEPPSPYDRGYAAACAEIERAMRAAIQMAPTPVDGSNEVTK